jgi:flagellar biosynthetic protein FlhB
MAQQDQNRSEEATPYKLKKAREKGMVARSAELGFLGGLIALATFGAAGGAKLLARLAEAMRTSFTSGIERAGEPEQAQAMVGRLYATILEPLMLFGATILAVVIFLEILQLRGLIFTAKPLNPATGIKRLFSARMLKETLKTVLKSAIYAAAAWLVLRDSSWRYAEIAGDGERLAGMMASAGLRLILVFAAIALFFVILDQVLVRGEYRKQMRMSRRDITQETREHDGDPKIKAKRKKLHAEFASQSKGTGSLPGSDMLIVNPEHFAVALRYDPAEMRAPRVTAKGRNRFALALKDEAHRLGIPILSRPPLARALFRQDVGTEISPASYEPVAELYIALRCTAPNPEAT